MASTLTKKIGPCGGERGSEKDMDINGISRIVNISIRHGSAIDAIAIRFLRDGHEESTEMWGGQGGNLAEFDLQESEYITSVTGYMGKVDRYFSSVVRSLKFETNLRTLGPCGQEQGISFELPAMGGQIIGFHGRSETLLDAFGVYVKSPQVIRIGPCGGDEGSARDMDTDGITRIVKISIRHCVAIDALTVHFIRNDRREKTERWGGSGGNLKEFKLRASEYITSVKGHLGYNNDMFLVKSLTFVTNLKSYGPYGTEDGLSFELQGISGQIIGFYGRSGSRLHALGVYVKVISDDRPLRLECNHGHGCLNKVTSGITGFLAWTMTNLGFNNMVINRCYLCTCCNF